MFGKKKNTVENKEKDINEQQEQVDKEVVNETAESSEQAENQVETVEEELTEEEKLKKEVQELNDKYLRIYSEFENYRRRTSKERLDLLKSAGQDILAALLPVVDDFDRAVKTQETSEDLNALKEGVILVHNKLHNILQQKGLKQFESIGKTFDSDYHEAITKIPAPDKKLKGKVVDEVEKGYMLNDKVLRFAKVVVGE